MINENKDSKNLTIEQVLKLEQQNSVSNNEHLLLYQVNYQLQIN